MEEIVHFLEQAVVDGGTVSLGDGRGNSSTDLFSRRSVVELLQYMATRPDFATYHDALSTLA